MAANLLENNCREQYLTEYRCGHGEGPDRDPAPRRLGRLPGRYLRAMATALPPFPPLALATPLLRQPALPRMEMLTAHTPTPTAVPPLPPLPPTATAVPALAIGISPIVIMPITSNTMRATRNLCSATDKMDHPSRLEGAAGIPPQAPEFDEVWLGNLHPAPNTYIIILLWPRYKR